MPKDLVQGEKAPNLRPDFTPAPQIRTKAVTPTGAGHPLTLARYRDTLLEALKGTLSPPLFIQLDRRSLDVQGAKANNTEIAYYSDMIAYVQFCTHEQLTPVPFMDRAMDAYLSSLMEV